MPALPIIALAASAIGSGVSAYSSIQQGKSANALANYNANQETINAEATTRDANIQANAVRMRNRQIEGHRRAAMGANGGVIDTGSDLLNQVNAHANLEMGALEVERQGTIESGKQLQQADINSIEGKNNLTASRLGAASTIIKGVGSASSAAYTNGWIGSPKTGGK